MYLGIHIGLHTAVKTVEKFFQNCQKLWKFWIKLCEKKINASVHEVGHCFCWKFYCGQAGGDFWNLHWHESCSVKFWKDHLLRAQNWGKLSWNSASEELAFAENSRVSRAFKMQRSDRWKLIKKRRLPACGFPSFLDPLLFQNSSTKIPYKS